MRATKQDIGQRAIRTSPIAVRNCRNSTPTRNLPRAVCRGYHNSRSDMHLSGLACTRLKPTSLLQHEILAHVRVGSKAAFSSRPTNVRSTSKSGVKADILEPPLSADFLGEVAPAQNAARAELKGLRTGRVLSAFFEALQIFRKNHPMLSRTRPDLPIRLNPVGVV
jgi:hypothetical protein